MEISYSATIEILCKYDDDDDEPFMSDDLTDKQETYDFVYKPRGRIALYGQHKYKNGSIGKKEIDSYIAGMKKEMQKQGLRKVDFVFAALWFSKDLLEKQEDVFINAKNDGIRLILMSFRWEKGRLVGELPHQSGVDYMCELVAQRRNETIGGMIDEFYARKKVAPSRQIVDPRLQIYVDMIANPSISDDIKMQLSNQYYTLVSRGLFPGGETETTTSGPKKVLDAPEMVKNTAAGSADLPLADLQTDPDTDCLDDHSADPVEDLPLTDPAANLTAASAEPPTEQLDSNTNTLKRAAENALSLIMKKPKCHPSTNPDKFLWEVAKLALETKNGHLPIYKLQEKIKPNLDPCQWKTMLSSNNGWSKKLRDAGLLEYVDGDKKYIRMTEKGRKKVENFF